MHRVASTLCRNLRAGTKLNKIKRVPKLSIYGSGTAMGGLIGRTSLFLLNALLAMVMSGVVASPAFGQENLVIKQAPAPLDKKTIGWIPSAKIGINASVTSASDVVGQSDGASESYGVDLKGSYNFVELETEWRNSLSYAGTAAKTPLQPRFIKSADALKFETLYMRTSSASPDFGRYADASAASPVFFGEDARAAVTTYQIKRLDGRVEQVSGNTLKLTDGFKPLTTKESAGFFWKALKDEAARVELRLGVGAQQVSADGQLAVTGVSSDGSVAVVELRTLQQVGLEGALAGRGKIDERTGWEAGLQTLTPLIANKEAGDQRDALRLTNIEAFAKLSSNLTSWAALSYDYKVAIKPQLVDRTQQTHLLVLNINYNLF